MAAIAGIKLTSSEESKGPVAVRTGDIDNITHTHDPWYGPKKISSNPTSTDDYHYSATPVVSTGELSSALAAHKRGEIKSDIISEQLGKINLRTGINAFDEVRWLVNRRGNFELKFGTNSQGTKDESEETPVHFAFQCLLLFLCLKPHVLCRVCAEYA